MALAPISLNSLATGGRVAILLLQTPVLLIVEADADLVAILGGDLQAGLTAR